MAATTSAGANERPRLENKIQLEIVTPRGKALDAVVDEVTAPSVAGEFGVMPGHLPLIAAVRTGIVTYKQGSDQKKCAVGAGFAEAGSNKLLILTDQYVERQDIDPVLVRKELADVQAEISKLMSQLDQGQGAQGSASVELPTLIAKENWLAAELELYGDPPPATMRPFEEWGPAPPPPEDEVPTEELPS